MNTKSYFEKLEKKYGTLTFGGFLSAWREAEELNQTAFAKKLGFSVQNLNDLKKAVAFLLQRELRVSQKNLACLKWD